LLKPYDEKEKEKDPSLTEPNEDQRKAAVIKLEKMLITEDKGPTVMEKWR